jgi:hypothetical protein
MSCNWNGPTPPTPACDCVAFSYSGLAWLCVRSLFALFAKQCRAQTRFPAVIRRDPKPVGPRRIVPDVLRVPAFEIRDPIAVFVLLKSDDLSLGHLV